MKIIFDFTDMEKVLVRDFVFGGIFLLMCIMGVLVSLFWEFLPYINYDILHYNPGIGSNQLWIAFGFFLIAIAVCFYLAHTWVYWLHYRRD